METIKVIEPRVNVKSDVEKNHVVLQGGLRVNEQVHTADSWGSAGSAPTQALFTINPPSTSTITDRYMKIRGYFEVTVDADLQLGTNDSLRQFPISSITETLTVQINGESISDNLADKLHAMLCYGNTREDRVKSWSTSPCMPDNYQQYNDWVTYGSAKNPLADYGENNGEDPRGGFPVTLDGVTPLRKFRVVVTEPVLLSPFLSGIGGQEEGFVNVNQLNINYRFKSDLSQFMSHSSAGNAITAVTVTMYAAPEILTTFITPDLSQPIPQLQVLPYHKSQDYIKTGALLVDGASTRLISDSIKLSQIPRKLYLFARHSRATSDQDTSDAFLRVDGLSILWNNQSGLFSSATEQDLYEISSKNGLNLSYPQWRKYRGGVVCLEFGKDIGLLDSEAPGVMGQFTCQIQMDVTNVSGSNFTPEFYQIFMMEGSFSIAENLARASLGNLTQSEVLAVRDNDEIDYAHYENLQGGGFFGKLKHFVSKAARGVQKGAKLADSVGIPYARDVGRVAKSARALTGGSRSAGRLNPRALAGSRYR